MSKGTTTASKKSEFTVTEKAGHFVAGQRSPGKDKPILLTEEQARYPLIAGEIRRPSAKAEEQPTAQPSAKAKKA